MPEFRCTQCQWEGEASEMPYASPLDAESQYCPSCEASAGHGGCMELIEEPNYMFGDILGDQLTKSRNIDRSDRTVVAPKSQEEILEENRKAIAKVMGW